MTFAACGRSSPPTLGRPIVRAEVADAVVAAAEALARRCGAQLVDVPVQVPEASTSSGRMSNLVQLRRDLERSLARVRR